MFIDQLYGAIALPDGGFPPVRLSLSVQDASFLIHPVKDIAFAKDDAHNDVNVPRIQSRERPSSKHTKGEHMQIRLLKNLSFVSTTVRKRPIQIENFRPVTD